MIKLNKILKKVGKKNYFQNLSAYCDYRGIPLIKMILYRKEGYIAT